MASRRVPESPGLRARTARGGVVNAAFLSGAELLVLLQGLLATALLGPDAIGLYGIVTTTAMTIVALRRVGIDEAFVQTAADDEEAEFQRALTVELALGVLGALAVAALAPVLAAAYDDDRLLGLTLAVTYLPVAFALQAPQWVFFKRMEYVRLRLLQVIVPLGTVAVAVPLLLAGVGVWSLVIGPFVGNLAAILAAWRSSPYKLRLRPDRAAARRYLRFSWPVFVTALVALVVAQGQIAVFGLEDGLVAAGYITLAATLTRYADRADQILATTIYPAIVRVRDRVDVLEELFEKANRLTLMWAFPFGAGLALFGPDLIVFVLGDDWRGRDRAARRARGGGRAAAGGVLVVRVLPGARRVLAAGGRVGRARRVVRAAGRAGRAAVGVVGVRGRADRLHAVRLGRALGLRAAAAARRPPAAGGGAGVRAGGARHSARAGPAIGVVGRRTAALAGSVGVGDLARRAGVGDLALRADPAGRAARVPEVKATLLWIAAALISGFTLRRYLGPLDEGVLMQAASRMAEGQLPWRDFSWAYGPGQPLAVLVFGDSLLSWRFLRVGADATTAVLVWALVRDAASALGAPGVARGGGHDRAADQREPDRPGPGLRPRRRAVRHEGPRRVGGRVRGARRVLAPGRGGDRGAGRRRGVRRGSVARGRRGGAGRR